MVQRYDFPAQTQLGNVGDPTNPQDAATRNYVDSVANGFTLDTPPTYANASVASGNIVLTNPFTAGQVVSSFLVQTTNAAGTETSIAAFINAKGVNQLWAFASAPTVTFSVTSTVTSTGQVALNLSAATTFPAIDRGIILQFQTTPQIYTTIRDLTLGTNIAGTVANNTQGRSTLTISATGTVAGSSAIDIGSVYIADNQALTVRVASNTPTSTTVNGTLAAVVDFGSVNIISSPWPPFTIPAGFNTQFLLLEAADFSWSGVGLIQTAPSFALTQIAWIRKPTQAAGTGFTNARCWPVTASIGYSLVGTSTTDAQSRNPNSTLLFSELQVTQVSDALGGNAASVRTQPFIDSRIAALIGSQTGATPLSPLTSAVIVRQGSSNVQLILETLVDSSVLAAQLNALGVNASFIGTTNNSLPDLQVSSWASEGVANVSLVANLIATVTFAQAQTIFAGSTSNQMYYGANAQAGNFIFRANPQSAIDARAFNFAQNNILTGTGLRKDVDTVNKTITLTNTGSGGVASSNFTTFINDLGQSLGSAGFVSFVSNLDQNIWVGLGQDSDVSDANDGGLIGSQKILGTRVGTATTTYGFGAIFPFAATYADLQVDILLPSMVITFTSTSSTGWDLEVYFSKASSTAASDPGRNANLFPAFRDSVSDLVSFNTLRSSQLVIEPVAGQVNTFTATISGGGLYSAVANNYVHTDTLNEYLPWIRLDGPAVTSIVSVVITQSNSNAGNSGGYRALASLPGTGGATPSLQQVLTVGNQTGNNPIVFQDAATTPRQISLRAPAAVTTSYAMSFPTAQAANPNLALVNDSAGNLTWGSPGLGQVLATNNSASAANIVLQGGRFITNIGLQLNGSTSGNVLWQAPSTVTSYTLTMPAAQATAANQTILNDGAGTLTWGAAGGVPGGTNLSYQWNNNGVFAGDTALIRDTVNSRVSAAAPAIGANVARLTDVQNATAGIRPVDTQGQITNIAEVNVAGTYVNNTGTGTATFSGTGQLVVAGRTVNRNEAVVLVNQTAQLQNGGYTVTSTGYSLTITFLSSTSAPNVATSVAFSFTNILGGSANFNLAFRANQLMSSAIATAPSGLDPSWTYSSTAISLTLTSNTGAVRWTTTPTLTVTLDPNVFWSSSLPNQNIFTPAISFVLTRSATPPAFGNLWVSTATTATNYGVQYFNTTPSPITVGTTNITFAIFGVSNAAGQIPGLSAVLGVSNTSSTSLNITTPGTLSSPSLTLTNPSGNTIAVSAPASIGSNYGVTLPSSAPSLGSSLVATSATGLSWASAGIETVAATATANITLSGATVVDGYTPALNDRILATNQTTNTQNGLYLANPSGAWVRVTTYISQTVFSRNGTTNANKLFTRIENATSAEVWIATSGGGTGTIPTLDQVTGAGANSTRAITLQPTGGYSLGLSGSATTGTPAITLTSAGATDVVNLNITTKGANSSVNFISTSGTALAIRPLSSGNAYHVIDAAGSELRFATTSTPGFSMGNLASDGTVAPSSCALNVRSVASMTTPPTFAILRLRALGHPTSSPNVDIQLEPLGTGRLGLGLESSGGVYLGQPNLTTFMTPLFAANTPSSPTGFSSGMIGQVLTSRGSGTPCWATPSTTGIAMYNYALSGDQTSSSVPLTFNTTASFSQGASFGSWLTSSLFAFTSTGIYLAVFSFNVTGGSADISLVFNGNRIAGATGGGKQEVTGFGQINVVTQTFQVQNFTSTSFSAGQSSVTLLKLS